MQPVSFISPCAVALRAIFVALTLTLVAGCGDGSVDGPLPAFPSAPPASPAPPPTPTPSSQDSLVVSGVMSDRSQGIRVSRRGAAVTDAIVTVNGVQIGYCCGNLYSGKLPDAIKAGDTLNLKVVAGGVTVEGTGIAIGTPNIALPAAGSVIGFADTLKVAWATDADPDRFEVCLNCWENSLDGALYGVPGSARNFTITPSGLVDYGTGAVVAVYARNENFMKFVGAESGSVMLFVSRSADARIKINY